MKDNQCVGKITKMGRNTIIYIPKEYTEKLIKKFGKKTLKITLEVL